MFELLARLAGYKEPPFFLDAAVFTPPRQNEYMYRVTVVTELTDRTLTRFHSIWLVRSSAHPSTVMGRFIAWWQSEHNFATLERVELVHGNVRVEVFIHEVNLDAKSPAVERSPDQDSTSRVAARRSEGDSTGAD